MIRLAGNRTRNTGLEVQSDIRFTTSPRCLRRDSNSRPSAYKADALPTKLQRHESSHPDSKSVMLTDYELYFIDHTFPRCMI